MTAHELPGLAALVFAAAALYSMVGHAGASGYLAAMALYGVAPAVMKPAALVLNILVALIGTVQFVRAGAFSWQQLWPFALGSVPLAFVGGAVSLPTTAYKRLVGLVVLYAAFRLLRHAKARGGVAAARPAPRLLAVPLGAAIGLLSGLVGVGGGIFLSPLLLLAGWADPRTTAGVSAAFILVNSAAGLLGHVSSVTLLPGGVGVLAAVAAVGGFIGSTLGSRRVPNPWLRRALAVVLVIAGIKLIFMPA